MLNVDIRVNDIIIQQLQIGRLEDLRGKWKIHKYSVELIDTTLDPDPIQCGVVEHLYTDGALVLTNKALALAITQEDIREQHNGIRKHR